MTLVDVLTCCVCLDLSSHNIPSEYISTSTHSKTLWNLDVCDGLLSHKETGSVQLSYRCSYELCRLTLPRFLKSSVQHLSLPHGGVTKCERLDDRVVDLRSTSSCSALVAIWPLSWQHCRHRATDLCFFRELWSSPPAGQRGDTPTSTFHSGRENYWDLFVIAEVLIALPLKTVFPR